MIRVLVMWTGIARTLVTRVIFIWPGIIRSLVTRVLIIWTLVTRSLVTRVLVMWALVTRVLCTQGIPGYARVCQGILRVLVISRVGFTRERREDVSYQEMIKGSCVSCVDMVIISLCRHGVVTNEDLLVFL